MTGKVLFCDVSSFVGKDGQTVTGYSLGVYWKERDRNRVKEFWKREEFAAGEIVNVVYSKKYQNYMVFKEEPLTLPVENSELLF